jgi:type 1 glutamine amidotransferase
MQRFLLPIFVFIFIGAAYAQDLEAFPLTAEWLDKIEKLAPDTMTVQMDRKKNILIFSLFTGFEHWTIPHTEAVVNCIAAKSKGFTVTTSTDVAQFEADNLAKYDAIVLNNNCSIGDNRNLFWDVLKTDPVLSDAQRWSKAQELENNLLEYVKNGGGLMVLHGGIVMQNKSEKFGEMLGGSFDYHPKQQKIKVKLVAADHPLVRAFQGSGFEHTDEPYFFNNAYFDYNFRPLLYMEAATLVGKKEEVEDNVKYISWIKRFGQGRVFYCSPSHNAQSMENPQMLQFLLDGLQYVTGDLVCDDSPIRK